jgi:hypothetical protein
MPDTELANLRRARVRVHAQLNKLEPMVEGYRAKLAVLEARIQAIAPDLFIQPRRYKPNPIFARGELTRFALAVLREAGEPLPIRTIAARVLAMKGVALAEPAVRRRTRAKLRNAFIALDKRGVTVRIGDGNESRRALGIATGDLLA